MKNTYSIEFEKFFSYSFSLDCLLFGYKNGQIHLLLIKRNIEPFKGEWAIPGDLVYPNEDLPQAASRILFELTQLKELELHQGGTFGAPDRHPMGRVITCAYFALVQMNELNAIASSWAHEIAWIPLNKIKKLAFDHNAIVDSTIEILQHKLKTQPVCFDLLPEKFTLNELQCLYESAFNEALNKANFRKKIKTIPFLKTNEKEQNVKHRPAILYKFDATKYERLVSKELFKFKM